jgi:hypothetical protein
MSQKKTKCPIKQPSNSHNTEMKNHEKAAKQEKPEHYGQTKCSISQKANKYQL